MAYRPTSLDFINRPNPVEPHTDPHKHPLHVTDQSHLRLLHDASNNTVLPTTGTRGPSEPSRKRRKSGDEPRPTLPAVRQQGEKRLRIPPTLSGLHQPPPDAGILPSISVNGGTGLRRGEVLERGAVGGQQSEVAKVPVPPTVAEPAAEVVETGKAAESSVGAKGGKSRKNKKWTDEETKCLLKGVEKHGIGSWTKILKDPDFAFDERRTALDLKDRFRVCCPDQYKATKQNKPSSSSKPSSVATVAAKPKRTRTTHRKTDAELRDLGIEAGFAQSGRRKRTAYSEAEDRAILEGFRKYGNKWAVMQQDEDLELEARTPMDLRDRMRTRWPEEYAKAGLKLKANKEASGAEGKSDQHTQERKAAGENATRTSTAPGANARIDQPASRPTDAVTTQPASMVPPPPLPHPPAKRPTAPSSFLSASDDVFWGLPLDAVGFIAGSGDDERITLDRRILDWPMSFDNGNSRNNGTMIDAIATLNLPRPTNVPPPPTNANASAATLPSLATITAGSLGGFDFGDIENEQLELPSLLEGFGALEEAEQSMGVNDGRAGGGGGGGLGMMSLEEILG